MPGSHQAAELLQATVVRKDRGHYLRVFQRQPSDPEGAGYSWFHAGFFEVRGRVRSINLGVYEDLLSAGGPQPVLHEQVHLRLVAGVERCRLDYSGVG